jgi:hypothetical protein
MARAHSLQFSPRPRRAPPRLRGLARSSSKLGWVDHASVVAESACGHGVGLDAAASSGLRRLRRHSTCARPDLRRHGVDEGTASRSPAAPAWRWHTTPCSVPCCSAARRHASPNTWIWDGASPTGCKRLLRTRLPRSPGRCSSPIRSTVTSTTMADSAAVHRSRPGGTG